MKKFYLVYLLILISSCSNSKSIFFPFHKNIAEFNTEQSQISLHKSDYTFTKNFSYFEKGFLCEAKGQSGKRHLIYLNNGNIKKIDSGKNIRFYIYKNFVLKKSSVFNENGFKLQILIFKNLNLEPAEKEFYLDCFPSDFTMHNGRYFISGVNRENTANTVYSISEKGSIQEIFSSKKSNGKDRDFIYFLSSNNRLFIYNSSLPGSKTKKFFTEITSNTTKEIIFDKSNLAFFGKAFSNNFIYIPAIDKTGEMFLLKYIFEKESLKLKKTIPLNKGFHSAVISYQNNQLFIAYNFYKSRTNFSTGIIDIENDSVKYFP